MSTDVHTLSGAYALDALDPAEAAEFRLHLAECTACRDEVRELRGAAARMGASEAVTPPPELKARVLAAAARTPQQPPRTPVTTTTSSRATDQPEVPGEPDQLAARRHRSRWLGLAAAAVVLVAGGVLGAQLLDDGPGLAPAVVQVLDASDARTATVETANGGRLTVGVSPSRDEMAVDTRDLPDLEDGRVYQIWAAHGSEMVSAGVLDNPDQGAAMGLPEEGTEVALTVEPAGGSPAPTGDPIIQVDPRDLLT